MLAAIDRAVTATLAAIPPKLRTALVVALALFLLFCAWKGDTITALKAIL